MRKLKIKSNRGKKFLAMSLTTAFILSLTTPLITSAASVSSTNPPINSSTKTSTVKTTTTSTKPTSTKPTSQPTNASAYAYEVASSAIETYKTSRNLGTAQKAVVTLRSVKSRLSPSQFETLKSGIVSTLASEISKGELSRLTTLYPEFRQLLTEADMKALIEGFFVYANETVSTTKEKGKLENLRKVTTELRNANILPKEDADALLSKIEAVWKTLNSAPGSTPTPPKTTPPKPTEPKVPSTPPSTDSTDYKKQLKEVATRLLEANRAQRDKLQALQSQLDQQEALLKSVLTKLDSEVAYPSQNSQ